MDVAELEVLLAELRRVGTDHQRIEAKRSKNTLPSTTAETLSAFGNGGGGLLLLGVDEAGGQFAVTGLTSPQRIETALQSLCTEMEPPLRPVISIVAHPEGLVLVAAVPAVPRDQRPCHRRHLGPHASSFVRVGDADQRLSLGEVSELLAGRSPHDHSRAPAPEGARLDPDAVRSLARVLRQSGERSAELDDPQISRRWGLTIDDRPTLAGLLTLGEHPQAWSACAVVTYRRLPRADAPQEARFAGRHLAGTVGELLDDVMSALTRDLETVQTVRDGAVLDELDVPREALREIVSNALIHRSFSASMASASVLVEVSDEAVIVTSPGGLHVGADPETLGLGPIAGVRNLTLVRLAEQLRTPSGARIVEHQASGIAAADRACRRSGTMPALFVDQPAAFQVVLLRRNLDLKAARRELGSTTTMVSQDMLRLVAVAQRLAALRRAGSLPALSRVALDVRLAARALSPAQQEDAAILLGKLEESGALRRSNVRGHATWLVATTPARSRRALSASRGSDYRGTAVTAAAHDRVIDVLVAIATSTDGTLSARDLGEALGLFSPSSRNKWIRRAVDLELIASDKASVYDRTAVYSLTARGQVEYRRLRSGRS